MCNLYLKVHSKIIGSCFTVVVKHKRYMIMSGQMSVLCRQECRGKKKKAIQATRVPVWCDMSLGEHKVFPLGRSHMLAEQRF